MFLRASCLREFPHSPFVAPVEASRNSPAPAAVHTSTAICAPGTSTVSRFTSACQIRSLRAAGEHGHPVFFRSHGGSSRRNSNRTENWVLDSGRHSFSRSRNRFGQQFQKKPLLRTNVCPRPSCWYRTGARRPNQLQPIQIHEKAN